MSSEGKTSRTERKQDTVDRLAGTEHFETTIHDPDSGHTVTGAGNTAEESEKNASEKYDRYFGDDD